MDNRVMNSVKNMAIGAVVGARALAAGSMYMNENRDAAHKAVKNIKRAGKKVTKAGEDYIRDIIE